MKETKSIKNGINYADYKIIHKDSAGVYTIEKYESIAYFMEFLAQIAAEGKKNKYAGVKYLTADVPTEFENVKKIFLDYASKTKVPFYGVEGIDNITYPHLPISYCIISNCC